VTSQNRLMTLSRRELLKGFGAGALALGLGGTLFGKLARVRAQEGYVPTVSAFSTFRVGDTEVIAIEDGNVIFDAAFFAVNAPPEEINALVAEYNMPAQVQAYLNTLLVKAGDQRILIDTGLGLLQLDPSTPPTAGRLAPTLALLGVAPEDITDVIISHFHPDHIGGVGTFEAVAYPNARYHFPQGDYDLLQLGSVGNEQTDNLIGLANGLLGPIQAADQLNLYPSDSESELVGGISVVPAPGHTPGHVALRIASGGDSLLLLGDAITQAVISLANPGYHMGFDADPAQAVESRTALLEMVAAEGERVLGYHFPFPGVGLISAEGDGYRFTPYL
jgi:glyoxylase-like metal-dependent hydrolase (beta-lactamase superfamily II)